jgi:hypothetical protein
MSFSEAPKAVPGPGPPEEQLEQQRRIVPPRVGPPLVWHPGPGEQQHIHADRKGEVSGQKFRACRRACET